jgi:[ribosomal protein S18]-alanine N-acetyltransferase
VSTRSAEVVLRDAAEGDAEAVATAEQELFGADAWTPALVADALAGRTALLAEVDGVIAGYAVLAVAGEVADLERIAVLAPHRRSGLATALLNATRARARAAGAARLLLEVSESNRGARAFYATRGSVELDRRRRYYRDGSDALVLQLPLAPEGAGSRG